MENDPHQLLEGVLIACYANQVTTAYIYIRAEMHEPYHILARAVEEAYAAGYLGRNIFGSTYSVDLFVHRGAGAYVCGEETGLLESLEGKRGWPRIKPPYPAVAGLFAKPTIINNVGTLCCVKHIIERGADWFLSLGPAGSHGPKLYCISGPVKRPGIYEMATGLREGIDLWGRLRPGDARWTRIKSHPPRRYFHGGLDRGRIPANESGLHQPGPVRPVGFRHFGGGGDLQPAAHGGCVGQHRSFLRP